LKTADEAKFLDDLSNAGRSISTRVSERVRSKRWGGKRRRSLLPLDTVDFNSTTGRWLTKEVDCWRGVRTQFGAGGDEATSLFFNRS